MVRHRHQSLRLENVVVEHGERSKINAEMPLTGSIRSIEPALGSNETNPIQRHTEADLLRLLTDLRRARALLAKYKAQVHELRCELRAREQLSGQDSATQEAIQGITHDLANMIETIGTAAVMISGDTSQSTPLQQSMEAAIDQTDSLLEALRQASSSNSLLPLEAVDAGNIIEEVIQSAMLSVHAPGIRVNVQTEHLPKILCHAPSFNRCLHNLIWNAVQAMPTTGRLDITGWQKGNEIFIEVSDTGPGIPADMKTKVFSARFTTKRGHQGLGLYVVRSLVKRMGGQIAVSSQPGQGAVFSLIFPIAKVEPIRQGVKKHNLMEAK